MFSALWCGILRSRFTIALPMALLTGCGLAYDYKQCLQDTDCPAHQGEGVLFCTSDHLCVDNTPRERLCPEKYPANAPPDAVPIGTLLYLSTPQIKTTLRLQAMKMGIDDVNSFAGAGVRTLVLHICDTGQQQTELGQAADTLKALEFLWNERKVVAVIGPMRSSEMIAAASAVNAQHVPLISPSAGAAQISDLPQLGYLFRTYPSGSMEVMLLAGQIPKDRTMAMMWISDAVGRDFHAGFFRHWAGVSSNVISETWSPGDKNDLITKAQKVMRNNPATVVAVPTVDTKAWMEQFTSWNSDAQFYLSSGSRITDLLEIVGKAPAGFANRIHGVAPVAPASSAELADFRSSFASRFEQADPTTDIFSPYTYDAFYAVAIAIESLPDKPTGEAVAQALQRIRLGQVGTPVGPTFFLKAIQQLQTGSLTLKGTTGNLGFDEHGDRLGTGYELWSIDGTTVPPRFTGSPL